MHKLIMVYVDLMPEQDLFKLIFEGISSEVMLLDAACAVAHLNTAAKKLLAYNASEPDINHYLKTTDNRTLDRAYFDQQPPDLKNEMVCQTAEGAIPVTATVSKINFHEATYYVLTLCDMSKQAETLNKMLDDLQTTNEELERFAYVTSHDLQEPLRMMVSFAGILRQQYSQLLDGPGKNHLSYIINSGKRMQELIRDLLLFSRIGKEAELKEDINCNESIDYILETLGPSLEKARAHIHVAPLPHIIANPVRFNCLLQNLISNAVKYRRPGVAPEVHISATEYPHETVFRIQDNGIGIKPEYVEQIFLPFKRLHTRDKYTGTGIGLAICKKIIDNKGGEIRVESTPGEGSTFIFSIPRLPRSILRHCGQSTEVADCVA